MLGWIVTGGEDCVDCEECRSKVCRFVGCGKSRNGCNYFQWVDDDYSNRSRNVIGAMRRKIKEEEEQQLLELQKLEDMK